MVVFWATVVVELVNPRVLVLVISCSATLVFTIVSLLGISGLIALPTTTTASVVLLAGCLLFLGLFEGFSLVVGCGLWPVFGRVFLIVCLCVNFAHCLTGEIS